jgi:predicted small integral membrane protein
MDFRQAHMKDYYINSKTKLLFIKNKSRDFTNSEAMCYWVKRSWNGLFDVITLPLTVLTICAFVFYIATLNLDSAE